HPRVEPELLAYMVGECGYIIRGFSYYECIGESRTRKNFLAGPQRTQNATCHNRCTRLQSGRRYSGERRSAELQRIEYTDHREAKVTFRRCAHRKLFASAHTKRTCR